MSRGCGFFLEIIDWLLLAVHHYTPMNGLLYYIPVEVPTFILRKKAVINPQNNNIQCFIWIILEKHIEGSNKYHVCDKYKMLEDKYYFSGLIFLTSLHDIKIFKKKNPDFNVYGLETIFQPPRKYLMYEVYLPKVVDEEKQNIIFHLILLNDNEKSITFTIYNFSGLIRLQNTLLTRKHYFGKICFTSFDDRANKIKLRELEVFNEHKFICGLHKLILPVMAKDGETIRFKEWVRTQTSDRNVCRL